MNVILYDWFTPWIFAMKRAIATALLVLVVVFLAALLFGNQVALWIGLLIGVSITLVFRRH